MLIDELEDAMGQLKGTLHMFDDNQGGRTSGRRHKYAGRYTPAKVKALMDACPDIVTVARDRLAWSEDLECALEELTDVLDAFV